MAKGRKKRGSGGRFFLGMIVYALIFAVAVMAGLRLFWDYISEYEASRPIHAIEAYMDSFDAEHIRAISSDFIASLDDGVQNASEAEREVTAVMQQPLGYARKGSESSEKTTVYMIRTEDRTIGRVVLTREDNPRFGFAPWTVAEESYDFSWLLDSDEITVPEDWTVAVNGMVLDESYIVARDIPFEEIADLYEMGDYSFPHKVTYRIDNFVGRAPFEVYDAAGTPVDAVNGWDESAYLENCSEDEKAAMMAFTDEFLDYYIQCLSNFNRRAYSNYQMVRKYLVEDSPLDIRLREAIAGQEYAHSRGDEIMSITYNRFFRLSDGSYLVDITYDLDTIGFEGHVESTNFARVLLVPTAAGLKATNIYSY